MQEIILVISLVFSNGMTEDMSYFRPDWSMKKCNKIAKTINWQFSRRPEIEFVRVTCKWSQPHTNM